VFYCNVFLHDHLLPLYACVYPLDSYNFRGRQISFGYLLHYLSYLGIMPTNALRTIKFTTNKNFGHNEWLLNVLLQLFKIILLILNLANLFGPLQDQEIMNTYVNRETLNIVLSPLPQKICSFFPLARYVFNLPKVWFRLVNLDKRLKKYSTHVV
jgi:hypothetical protein